MEPVGMGSKVYKIMIKQFNLRVIIPAIVAITVILLLILLSINKSGHIVDINKKSVTNTYRNTSLKNNSNIYDYNDNKYKLSLHVSNIDTLLDSMSKSELDNILSQLAFTISLNTSGINETSVIIEKESFRQTYNDKQMAYNIKFSVNLPDLKQSYIVKDIYSLLPQYASHLYDDTQWVLCPTGDDVMYNDFNCKDRTMIQ